MVKAILDGRKTQTRRPVKPQPEYRENASLPGHYGTFSSGGWNIDNPIGMQSFIEKCRYGQPGDRLWVREALGVSHEDRVWYMADGLGLIHPDGYDYPRPVVPSIHMPRWASRITLEIANVRVERLQEINPADSWQEGFGGQDPYDVRMVEEGKSYGQAQFRIGWDSLNAARGFGWDKNPWVWVVEFKRI